jgi:hypothetical protein
MASPAVKAKFAVGGLQGPAAPKAFANGSRAT